MTFGERVRSVTVDGRVLATRTKSRYWDSVAADDAFGTDRVDRYWEETGGHGAIERGPDGELYHTDHRGVRKRASDEVLASFVDGDEGSDISDEDYAVG
jgi:hypothetical protein